MSWDVALRSHDLAQALELKRGQGFGLVLQFLAEKSQLELLAWNEQRKHPWCSQDA